MQTIKGAANSGGRQSSGGESASAIVTAAAKALGSIAPDKRGIEGRQMLVVHVRSLV
jgi:hypothetical protein